MGDDPMQAPMGRSPAAPAVALDEPVIDEVAGIGGTLYVTASSVVIVREGAELRPRNGIRTWPHEALQVRLERPRNGTGRLVLSAGPTARSTVSLFVSASHWPSAESVAGQIRSRAVRARRPSVDGEPTRPVPRRP